MFQHFILLLPTFICLLFAVLLLIKKSERNCNCYVGLGFFFLGISTYSYATYYEYNYQGFVYMDIIQSLSLLVIPFIFLYYDVIFAESQKLSKVLGYFIPPLVLISLYIILYTGLGKEDSVSFIKNYYYSIPVIAINEWEFGALEILNKYVFNALILIQLITLVWRTFVYYNKQNNQGAQVLYIIDDQAQYGSLFTLFSILIIAISIVLKIVIINPEIKHSLWFNESLFFVNSFALFFLGQKALFLEYIPKSKEEIESKETSFEEDYLNKKE